jgi:hypothetical protein
MTYRFPVVVRNALGDLLTDLIDAGAGAGKVRIYTGAQPASADDAVTGTLLVDIPLPDPAFAAWASGTAAMNNPAAVNATTTGTAGYFRILDSNNVKVMDGSVTTVGGGGELEVSTTAFVSGTPIDITAWTLVAPGA